MDLSSFLPALGGVFALYVLVAVLFAVVPGPVVPGYVVDKSGQPLLYKLNGLRVLFALVFLLLWLHVLGHLPLPLLYAHFLPSLGAAFVLGMAASIAMLIKGRSIPKEQMNYARRANTVDRPHQEDKEKPAARWGILDQFFCGLEFNPRRGPLDAKMYLYLVGAAALEVFVLAAVAEHAQQHGGTVSTAMLAYAFMLTWFVVEYLYHEHVHLYTYDFFAERVGFKLVWGCLTFYPFFYSIGIHSLVSATNDITSLQAAAIVALFLAGWIITRGANNQKYYYKTAPSQAYYGFVGSGPILAVGWWGAARHFNYFGEILQAIALALPGWLVSGSLLPFLYPVYYILLLGTRQIEDDRLCLSKYGRVWEDYMKAVPYRIVPYVW